MLYDFFRLCTFVNSVRPVVDEEMSMVAEVQQVEDIINKLGVVSLCGKYPYLCV